MTNDVGSQQVENEERVVHTLRAVDSSRADLAHLDSAHALAMSSAKEIQVHRKDCKEDLNGQGYAGAAISPLVDNQSEVVDLKHHAEVDQGTQPSSNEHSGFGEK